MCVCLLYLYMWNMFSGEKLTFPIFDYVFIPATPIHLHTAVPLPVPHPPYVRSGSFIFGYIQFILLLFCEKSLIIEFHAFSTGYFQCWLLPFSSGIRKKYHSTELNERNADKKCSVAWIISKSFAYPNGVKYLLRTAWIFEQADNLLIRPFAV